VDRALNDLTTSNLKSNQQTISDFNNLLNAGSDQLQDVFRSTLKEDIRPVEPLHYITKREPILSSQVFKILMINRASLPYSWKCQIHPASIHLLLYIGRCRAERSK
jgi:hypothetical protein